MHFGYVHYAVEASITGGQANQKAVCCGEINMRKSKFSQHRLMRDCFVMLGMCVQQLCVI